MRQCLALVILFFTFSAWADQLIIEPEMGREPILAAMNSAQHSIDLVMYGFTDKTLLNALLQKHRQGKTVRVILEKSPYKAESENTKTIAEFQANHLTWQGEISPFKLIHQKTLLIDNEKALVMTFNFTHGTFKNQRNFALLLEDAKQVHAIKSLFSADWNHTPYVNQAEDLILSPDNSREQINHLISQAKQSICIYAQNINDYKIVGALAKAAKKGVKVQIITSGKLRENQTHYLHRAGVHVFYSKKFIIHAKVIIIDDELAVLGSINLTRHSLDDNRELSVITYNPKIVDQLIETFNQDKKVETRLYNDDIRELLPDKRTMQRIIRQISKFFHD
jgi:phosphatidylserine/phosphatidylglycerophosphate/cardiolipin synthase-like enzyme